MSLTQNPYYKELKESLGPYEPVLILAKNTREICDSLENRISASTALDFACRGLIPDPRDFPDHRLDRVKDYIAYIDDVEIKSAIVASYEESLRKHNLIYIYNSVVDEPRRSRIRIILRILWDNRPHKNN